MVNEMLKKEVNVLIKLLEKTSNNHGFVEQELNGYIRKIPEYRSLNSKVFARYIDADGVLHENVLLSKPSTFPKSLYFDNFTFVNIYTGLRQLNTQLDKIQEEKISNQELMVLQDIFKDDCIIKEAKYILDDIDIFNLLKKIQKEFKINK